MASAVAPPKTPTTSTSTSPAYNLAVAQAKAALAAETTPIKNEQASSDAEFTQRAKDATDSAAAVSELLKPIGPAITQAYTTAEQNQDLLGQGFSHGMQDALQGNANNINDMLSKIGAPAQVDSKAAQSGDMLYGLGGYIPGKTFGKEGAGFAAAADLLPAQALERGQENVKSLNAQSIVADQRFQNKIAELAGKLPGEIQTNYMHLQTLALNDAKFREQVTKDNFDAATKSAQLTLAQAKYSTDTQYKSAQLKLASQRIANAQYNADRNYNVKLANLGIAQKNLQIKIMNASFSAANGGLNKKDVAKYTSVAQGIALDGVNGYTSYATKNGVKTAQVIGKKSYFEALALDLKKGVPVQIALDTLDIVYPAQYRPTAAALAEQLGPLDPAALAQVAAGMKTTPGINLPLQSSNAADAYKSYAFSKFGQYGWGPMDGQALDQMWQRESGWNPNAVNKGSGAAGIPQELGHTVPADYATNPHTQIDWGLNYIKQSYGSPSNAWSFWQATANKNAALAPAALRGKARTWISKGYVGY